MCFKEWKIIYVIHILFEVTPELQINLAAVLYNVNLLATSFLSGSKNSRTCVEKDYIITLYIDFQELFYTYLNRVVFQIVLEAFDHVTFNLWMIIKNFFLKMWLLTIMLWYMFCYKYIYIFCSKYSFKYKLFLRNNRCKRKKNYSKKILTTKSLVIYY